MDTNELKQIAFNIDDAKAEIDFYLGVIKTILEQAWEILETLPNFDTETAELYWQRKDREAVRNLVFVIENYVGKCEMQGEDLKKELDKLDKITGLK